ncbi:hypothetical protein RKD41_006418 [Streptomyces tendae]
MAACRCWRSEAPVAKPTRAAIWSTARSVGLQEVAGARHPLLDQPAAGTEAHLVAEAAGEGAPAHPGVPGEVGQGERLVQALQRPGAGRGGARGPALGDRLLDVLCLAAVAEGRYDTAPGDRVGQFAAVVGAHDVQADVDAGRGAGRGEDAAVVDEQHVRVDLDPRVHPAERLGDLPVGGGPASVEETGGGQDEGGRADRDDARVRANQGERAGELGGQLGGDVLRGHGGDDHGVGRGEDLRAVLHADGEVGVAAHRVAVHAAGQHLVAAVGGAEDPAGDAQLEGVHAVQRQHHHPLDP